MNVKQIKNRTEFTPDLVAMATGKLSCCVPPAGHTTPPFANVVSTLEIIHVTS